MPEATGYATAGACLKALCETAPGDAELAQVVVPFGLTVARVRDPQSWSNDTPPSPQLLAATQLHVPRFMELRMRVLLPDLPDLEMPDGPSEEEPDDEPAQQQHQLNGHREAIEERSIVFEHQGRQRAQALRVLSGEDLFGKPPVMRDQLVEKVLTSSGLSVVYGESNSGKTFMMLDLAASIARGESWLGRYRTQQGAVLYLASEGPTSVQLRLQAYMQHWGLPLPLFFIAPDPINLFDSGLHAEAIIRTVEWIEQEHAYPVRLIVGDTLASIAAGANENSGEDMGVVLSNIERVRTARELHFALVHHCGKNAAAGMRGWSGVNAKTDTTIEVLADADTGGHGASIVKQRDLPHGKGEEIKFELHAIELQGAVDNFGNAVTSCVVCTTEKAMPMRKTDRPQGARGRRPTAPGLVSGYLSNYPNGLHRWEVAKHFKAIEGGPSRTTIYRVIDELIADGLMSEELDVVRMRKTGVTT
jgi:AAA domain-containing protein